MLSCNGSGKLLAGTEPLTCGLSCTKSKIRYMLEVVQVFLHQMLHATKRFIVSRSTWQELTLRRAASPGSLGGGASKSRWYTRPVRGSTRRPRALFTARASSSSSSTTTASRPADMLASATWQSATNATTPRLRLHICRRACFKQAK